MEPGPFGIAFSHQGVLLAAGQRNIAIYAISDKTIAPMVKYRESMTANVRGRSSTLVEPHFAVRAVTLGACRIFVQYGPTLSSLRLYASRLDPLKRIVQAPRWP